VSAWSIHRNMVVEDVANTQRHSDGFIIRSWRQTLALLDQDFVTTNLSRDAKPSATYKAQCCRESRNPDLQSHQRCPKLDDAGRLAIQGLGAETDVQSLMRQGVWPPWGPRLNFEFRNPCVVYQHQAWLLRIIYSQVSNVCMRISLFS
jgi:hypothetical protein